MFDGGEESVMLLCTKKQSAEESFDTECFTRECFTRVLSHGSCWRSAGD